MNRTTIYVVICVGILLTGCKTDPSQSSNDSEPFRVNIRLKEDPKRINPIFAQSSYIVRQIFPYLFLSLGEYNPETLDLYPIVAKEVPEVEEITSGPYKGGQRIVFEILPDATWNNGTPITADDYIFTLKSILHPQVNADAYRGYFKRVTEVNILSEDKKKFEIIFGKQWSSALEAAISLEIMPSHRYDPTQALVDIPYETFHDTTALSQLVSQDTAFTAFAERYNSREFHVQIAEGTGPYALAEWNTDQYILLQKKENYWGQGYPDRPHLRAHPDELLFQIIPDEVTSITLLKDGSLDVIRSVLPEYFINLEKDPAYTDQLTFHTPQVSSYYYLALNNMSTHLSDPNIRKAMAHIIDVTALIETQDNGQGKRLTGIIPPFRPEYNASLPTMGYDLDQARGFLEASGWTDTDGDQMVDKIIDGKKTDLSIRFYTFKSALSQRMGLLTKEGAKKIGMNIELIQKKSYKTHWFNKDYDILPMKATLPLGEYNPYAKYHSENAGINGSNGLGYSNPEVDSIIEALSLETDAKNRKSMYKELQAKMYEDQPAVFLYSPVERIITSKRIKPLISVKKPGYFANSFTLASKYAFSSN